MSHIDLNQAPPNHTISVSVDRQETGAEIRVRLFKDVVMFMAALGFVALLAYLTFEIKLSDKNE